MKVKVVCRKLYDYVRYDLKEIAFPSSLVDPPHIKKRRKLTWHERFLVPQRSDASRGVFVFSDMNPYVGHQNPLKEGQELLRKGLLSEAVLALEAEVMKNPEKAEGWRLLGITHAENDDDQQAIAAMMRAQEADPTNLEVLLALGVGHTNELEQTAAIKYLYGWLRHHPKDGTLAPPELANSLYYADALDLKPNYVRAWANMGISYTNQTLPRHQHLPASYLRSKFWVHRKTLH